MPSSKLDKRTESPGRAVCPICSRSSPTLANRSSGERRKQRSTTVRKSEGNSGGKSGGASLSRNASVPGTALSKGSLRAKLSNRITPSEYTSAR